MSATASVPRTELSKLPVDSVPGLSENRSGKVWVPQRIRPRRNRKNASIRSMVQETILTPANFIYPLFIHEDDSNFSIPSLPGCERHSPSSVLSEVRTAYKLGIRSVILFPKVDDKLKSIRAEECHNADGLVPRTIRAIKEACPDMLVWTDVALDPYSSAGHDGIVADDGMGDGGKGRVLNDETVEVLCRQALCQAEAGADVVAPSDMMDGRIGAIRDALDEYGRTDVSIVAYTAKYASAFYGPFRDALESNPDTSMSFVPKDKKTYQMDPANAREALLEAQLDLDEGADMLMVKPGMPYLDIVKALSDYAEIPIAVYHVSGEYAMIKAAAQNGWLNEKDTVMESLLCMKRAGAKSILTYYARQAAQWMNE